VARRIYKKLVRDLIPDIIRQDGHACAVESLDEDAFRRALRAKLVEEAREAAHAKDDDDLATELADLQEVVDARPTGCLPAAPRPMAGCSD
jgi:predicted house-cleaning noncanonical NTP pyrophosphatase (MazG superfamily)